jgi:hypothetical protein
LLGVPEKLPGKTQTHHGSAPLSIEWSLMACTIRETDPRRQGFCAPVVTPLQRQILIKPLDGMYDGNYMNGFH